MSHDYLNALTDIVYEAHSDLQAAHLLINPVVELRSGMRTQGIPADVISIDCLTTKRRILLILHDEHANVMLYQFTTHSEEAGQDFKQIALPQVTAALLFTWMQDHFNPALDL